MNAAASRDSYTIRRRPVYRERRPFGHRRERRRPQGYWATRGALPPRDGLRVTSKGSRGARDGRTSRTRLRTLSRRARSRERPSRRRCRGEPSGGRPGRTPGSVYTLLAAGRSLTSLRWSPSCRTSPHRSRSRLSGRRSASSLLGGVPPRLLAPEEPHIGGTRRFGCLSFERFSHAARQRARLHRGSCRDRLLGVEHDLPCRFTVVYDSPLAHRVL